MPDVEKIVKVKMTDNGYDPTHGNFRKDGVYEFPQEQAIRIVRAGIGKPAPASARLAKEEDREARLKVARERQDTYDMDQEMSAAWDIEVRDLQRAEWEAEAAEEAAEKATDAVKRAQAARKVSAKQPESPEPGPVNTQEPARP